MIFTGIAVTVGVSMYVLSISRLSEVDMVMLLPKTTYFYSLYIIYSPLKNRFLLILLLLLWHH